MPHVRCVKQPDTGPAARAQLPSVACHMHPRTFEHNRCSVRQRLSIAPRAICVQLVGLLIEVARLHSHGRIRSSWLCCRCMARGWWRCWGRPGYSCMRCGAGRRLRPRLSSRQACVSHNRLRCWLPPLGRQAALGLFPPCSILPRRAAMIAPMPHAHMRVAESAENAIASTEHRAAARHGAFQPWLIGPAQRGGTARRWHCRWAAVVGPMFLAELAARNRTRPQKDEP